MAAHQASKSCMTLFVRMSALMVKTRFDDPWMTRMQRMAEKANSLRRDVDMGMGAL